MCVGTSLDWVGKELLHTSFLEGERNHLLLCLLKN